MGKIDPINRIRSFQPHSSFAKKLDALGGLIGIVWVVVELVQLARIYLGQSWLSRDMIANESLERRRNMRGSETDFRRCCKYVRHLLNMKRESEQYICLGTGKCLPVQATYY